MKMQQYELKDDQGEQKAQGGRRGSVECTLRIKNIIYNLLILQMELKER